MQHETAKLIDHANKHGLGYICIACLRTHSSNIWSYLIDLSNGQGQQEEEGDKKKGKNKYIYISASSNRVWLGNVASRQWQVVSAEYKQNGRIVSLTQLAV